MNALRRVAVDQYRKAHKLLTSQEIIRYREELDLSQVGFAKYLGVGEASVKRWETYYIQDFSQDCHIRIKCDEEYAGLNYISLVSKKKPDIFNGLKCFDIQAFVQIRDLFKNTFSHEEITHDNLQDKLFFYIDFLHFKTHRRSITGKRYTSSKSGPAPQSSQFLHKSLDKIGYQFFKPLDAEEKNTTYHLCGLCKEIGIPRLCDLSRQELGYVRTKDSECISYDYAKNLLLN